MRFVSYSFDAQDEPRFGFVHDNHIVDILRAAIWAKEVHSRDEFLTIPTSLRSTLKNWSYNFKKLKELASLIPSTGVKDIKAGGMRVAFNENEIIFHAPVFDPPSFRDFYAFEQHVTTARKLRNMEVPDIWFKIPVFYFSNHNSMAGHKNDVSYPNGSVEMDYELELGIYIAEGGKNISKENATQSIAAYTIINDWSARDFQREEMTLNLGPAKGKDFATSAGPFMVTPDELDPFIKDGKLTLKMTAYVNGKQLSEGNSNDLYHSFESMIERASNNVQLYPGDLIGSGTVGTGCILELRPENTNGWLKSGDIVTLTVEGLGTLENRIN